MLPWDSIKLSHMPFSLVPEVFNAVNVVMFLREQFAVIYSEMLGLNSETSNALYPRQQSV